MSWAVGYDERWQRWIGYGVPAYCDQPGCGAEIDRGLAYVCGNDPYGGEQGCGLFFCGKHLWCKIDRPHLCERCMEGGEPFSPTPDHPDWIEHQATHWSWKKHREALEEIERCG